MKFRTILLYALAALLAMLSLSSRAEDIDLFTGTQADQTLSPNLLLIIDNAANFSASAPESCIIDGRETAMSRTAGGVEQCAIYSVISALDLTGGNVVNLGIMMYNANGMYDYQGNDCARISAVGGCLVYPLTNLTEANRPTLLAWIKSWKTSGGGRDNVKVNSQATGAVVQEAWAYYHGKVGLSGRNYADIAPNINCKNFMVFIGNAYNASGSPGDATGDAGPKNALLGLNSTAGKNATPVATPLQRSPITLANGITRPETQRCGTVNFPSDNNHENTGYYADEWTRYMAANRITSYTVGFHDPGKCQAEYAWLLSSMATNGGGNYFPTSNYTELLAALNTILSEVRSVNSVFAAVSLPVSVNSQGTYLNQVFIGMFRPDTGGYPRWQGNLKQYKMGFLSSTGAFSLLDADNGSAISASGSEFIGECARSFWTPTATVTGDGYWTLLTNPNCTGYPASSNSPDGNMVEKGGQAYRLRQLTPTARRVKTCPLAVSDCTELTDFSTSNSALTTTTFGFTATTPITTETLINWARGSNNHHLRPEAASVNGTPITSANMRPSSHGDVVHSRPAAINFGTDASPKVVVFYGGNDGMLRAINGNRTAAFNVGGTSVPAGDEFWSFVPPEFYPKLLRRYNNDVPDVISPTNRKDYAMDGPIAAHRLANGDAWLYVGMRRGGRTMYAFHVNGSTLAITLKWKVGCIDGPSATDCNAAGLGVYSALGQTWSPPQVFTAAGVGAGATPLIVFGGGYNACEDLAVYACANTNGHGLYVANADTGVRQKLFPTERSVVADVTVVPDSTGRAKFIYGADMGGNVYRISGPLQAGQFQPIGSFAVADWVITKVASLGCNSGTGCTPNRKFMFAPDVVVDGNDYVLLLGSGDREKPTVLTNPVRNHFYMIKDRPDQGNSYLSDGVCGGTAGLCLDSLLSITQGVTPTADALATKKGWYLNLHDDEQVVTGAIAVFGTVYFTTHQPRAAASNACVPNLGVSRAYGVRYTNASAARNSGDLFLAREDAGLAPDLVVGKVTLDNNSTVPFCIGCDGPIKPSQPVPPGHINNPAKIRSYWYIQK